MKNKFTLVGISILILSVDGYSQPSVKGTTSNGWAVNKPFQRDVFIENKGQFSEEEKKGVGSKILYYSRKGSSYLYFTASGVVFCKDSTYKINSAKKYKAETEEDERDDEMRNWGVKNCFTKMQWVGCNPNVRVEVENETPDYFTFPNQKDKTGKSGILAHAWTKLIYKNIFAGIDIEFYYPEKGGIEYNIIVHPGADITAAKILYSGSSIALNGKDIKITTGCGEYTDHAPIAKDADGKVVDALFKISGKTVSFITGSYNKNKTLIIDPWITSTTLVSRNFAYDLGYDYLGNVYVYGGGYSTPFELQKYNNTGVLQWTYTAAAFTYHYAYTYGGLTVDHKTGTSYMCEGLDQNPVCKVVKVNYNGLQGALFAGANNNTENWRIGYDYCNNQVVVAAGQENPQSNLLDTNCTTITRVNVLAGASTSDMALLGFDNVGSCYMATCAMTANNILCKMPLPTLNPTAYRVHDKHDFLEASSQHYYGGHGFGDQANGFNGIAATPTLVYTYDGEKMRQWNAATGAIEDSAIVSGKAYDWGGLDIDCQGNVYAGNSVSISMYDSNMNSLGNIPLSDTVYDVRVAPNGNIYACGQGFVQSVSSAASKLATATATSAICSCIGTASAQGCGKGPFTYNWSNGATTQTISGLCAGTYTVTLTMGLCLGLSDTAIVSVGGGGSLTTTLTTVNPTCLSGGSATVTAMGGTSSFTYLWNPGGQTTPTAKGLSAGTYTVTVTENGGCSTTMEVIMPPITDFPVPAFSTNITSGCSPLCIQFYNQSTIPSGGVANSTWNFGNGDTLSSLNPIYCYKNPGIYSVKITATSDSGCSATLTKDNYITVYNNPKAIFTSAPQPTTILQPTIQFTDNSTDAYGLAEWNWSFGDASDSSSKSQNTSHTYHDTGTYCAHLAVMNIHGCTDTVTNCLVIDPVFALYIPSAFTPNGEKLNMIFAAKGNDIKSFEMYVFDRWGTELFHSTNINDGWNGTYKNTSCQEDAYVYVITVYDSENKKHSYTGTVNLLK